MRLETVTKLAGMWSETGPRPGGTDKGPGRDRTGRDGTGRDGTGTDGHRTESDRMDLGQDGPRLDERERINWVGTTEILVKKRNVHIW